MSKRIQEYWKKNAVMKELPQFEGSVLEVGDGETRCPYCNRLFFKGDLGSGSQIEIKCVTCKEKIRITKL